VSGSNVETSLPLGCDVIVMQKVLSAVNRAKRLARYPDYYDKYNERLFHELYSLYNIASKARSKGYDPSEEVEPRIVFDLADRVEHMFNLPLADRLRGLLAQHRTEYAALKLAEEVALGRFAYLDKEHALDVGVRVGLAVVTDGITVAPLQGISSVGIKKNEDGSNYIAVSFAGPIRSAGGTETAFTLVIADHLRKVLGFEKYIANAFGEDEVGRFIEELRIYEREVGNFQFRVSDRDIQHSILHMPVEVDGIETDPVEVIVHRDLRRIATNRIRGGALRVVNDGVIGRSRKLLKLVEDLSIPGWGWLRDLEGGIQQDSDEARAEGSHFQEVISGRPVLSMPGSVGGFRLRYGRSYNTGISTVGVHPAASVILDYSFVSGTQVKVNIPGKAATIAFVDSIEPPFVRLTDGSCVRVGSVDYAKEIKNTVSMIIHLGDILIAYGDFLENNVKLPPSGYVEEWWSQDLAKQVRDKYGTFERCSENLGIDVERLRCFAEEPFSNPPSPDEAFNLSKRLGLPLHPRYLFFWEYVSPSDILLLRQKLKVESAGLDEYILSAPNEPNVKSILETIGVPHKVEGGLLTITEGDAYAVMATLDLASKDRPVFGWRDIHGLLFNLSGVEVRRKSSVTVGVRIGRPEKAMVRKMKPPVHVLFPVRNYGGPTRDILQAAKHSFINIELANMVCSSCGSSSTSRRCSECGGEAVIQRICPSCNKMIVGEVCHTCKVNGVPYRSVEFPIRDVLSRAFTRVKYTPSSPLKGVKGLTNPTMVPEILEKGLLRRKYGVLIYKDGTTRFDATNAPLTHFKPKNIGTPVKRLRELGYTRDVSGRPLEDEDQLLEIFVQDIILPSEAGDYLVNVGKFLDELLTHLYGMKPCYNFNSREDVIGHVVVGLAPHTSVGILGRVIGFTESQVCHAHPFWHSAKRRDCDGDEDAVMLLLDVLLNFSKEFLPDQIGGLMDAPLLLQPIVIPYEVQRQAHNLDVAQRYPLEFYQASLREASANELADTVTVVRSRLKEESQFHRFGFTHPTNTLLIGRRRSIYPTLKTFREKLDKQIELARKIYAVDVDEVVSSVLKTHILPDIMGNLKAYTSQSFRCKSCGVSYRRFPLKGVCLSCGGELQQTVTRQSIEKYLPTALTLIERFKVGEYISDHLNLILEEFMTLFPEKDKEQLRLTQFFEGEEASVRG